MKNRWLAGRVLTVATAALLAACSLSWAEDPSPDPEPVTPLEPVPEPDPESVAATVNGKPIRLGEVNQTVRALLQGRPVNPAALQQVQAEVLDQLIGRELVQQKLTESGKTAPASAVNDAMNKVKQQAADNKVDFAKTLADRGLTEAELREQIAWQLNWGGYLQGALSDKELKNYFEAHKQEYDGSELRVSHVLLRPDTTGGLAETRRLKEMAEKLREQIETGKLTFEEAAKKYSAGPSRHKGGDLGYIPRTGLMLEPFSAAAFKLGKGVISEPVTTPYGVHLIKVTAVKPGRKLWVEVKDQLKAPVSQEIFEKLAAEEREKAQIEFTGECPHFKPGTREIASD